MYLKTRLKAQLGISMGMVDPEARGFLVNNTHTYNQLKKVGIAFLTGYHAALKCHEISISNQIEIISEDMRGFAYEGAAMGLTLMDFITFKNNRLNTFLEHEGKDHIYMTYVGAGWALARTPYINYEKFMDQLNPIFKWLVLDGHGFHDGYFHSMKVFQKKFIPKTYIGTYAERAYLQGVGRSLWFYSGCDLEKVYQYINTFPSNQKPDLWSGIGLACAYAGGVNKNVYISLKSIAGNFLPELAQGVAFAAKARQLANLTTAHTELAASIICGMSLEEAALITDETLANLPIKGDSYEVWRQNIMNCFRREGGTYEVL